MKNNSHIEKKVEMPKVEVNKEMDLVEATKLTIKMKKLEIELGECDLERFANADKLGKFEKAGNQEEKNKCIIKSYELDIKVANLQKKITPMYEKLRKFMVKKNLIKEQPKK